MRKWRLRHLLISWFAYWAAIVTVKLGSAIAAASTATSGPDDGLSSMGFNWSSGAGLHLEIQRAGETLWAGTTTIAAVVGWAVIPPLILWIIWLRLAASERADDRATGELGSGHAEDLPLRDRAAPFREDR
jgi:hypothetical protein